MTTSAQFGPAHNPWALDRICGGSSGGSGAAAAADLAAGDARNRHRRLDPHPRLLLRRDRAAADDGPRAHGRRRPGRPGRSTRSGRSPRSAEDCALLLSAIAGEPVELAEGVRGLRVGVVDELFRRADPAVAVRGARGGRRAPGPRRARRAVEVPLLEESGTINAAADAPGSGRGAPPVAAHAARRLRRRRPRAAARRAAASVHGARHRPARAALVLRRGCAAVRPVRRARRRRRCPIVAPPIGQDEVEVHGQADALPARADPVQLAVERWPECRWRACLPASSTACPSGSRSSAGRGTRRPSFGQPTRSSARRTGTSGGRRTAEIHAAPSAV